MPVTLEDLIQTACAYSRSKIGYCATLPGLSRDELLVIIKEVECVIDHEFTLEETMLNLLALHHAYQLWNFRDDATRVKQHRAGNCHFYATLVMNFAMKHRMPVTCEFVKIINGDHVFTVFNRAPGSDINDCKTWGPQAWVCDAWANKVYKAELLPVNLQAHAFDSRAYCNLLFPYNPRHHELSVVYTYDPDSYFNYNNELNDARCDSFETLTLYRVQQLMAALTETLKTHPEYLSAYQAAMQIITNCMHEIACCQGPMVQTAPDKLPISNVHFFNRQIKRAFRGITTALEAHDLRLSEAFQHNLTQQFCSETTVREVEKCRQGVLRPYFGLTP